MICIGVKKDDKIELVADDYLILQDDLLVLAGEIKDLSSFAEMVLR